MSMDLPNAPKSQGKVIPKMYSEEIIDEEARRLIDAIKQPESQTYCDTSGPRQRAKRKKGCEESNPTKAPCQPFGVGKTPVSAARLDVR